MRGILRRGLGLLVEDGWLAAAAVAWLLLAWALLPHLARHAHWGGPILFAGLAAILVTSTVRRSGPPG